MGSLIDLNEIPDTLPAVTCSASEAQPILAVPKLEPKEEPFDDFASVYDPNYPPNPITIPTGASTPNLLRNYQNGNEERVGDQDDAASSVYSEFARIAEQFRSAMRAKQNENMSIGDGNGAGVTVTGKEIVPANGDNQLTSEQLRVKYCKRSSELVRVLDLRSESQRYYRESVRHNRMIFDCLRIYANYQEEKRRSVKSEERLKNRRPDCRAAALMRSRGLWMYQEKRIVGSIPGVSVGDLFFYRMELLVFGLHGQIQAGIDYLSSSQSPSREPIATSVIISGGYEDDEDSGDVVVYTGHGGRDKFGKQCCHQKLEGGNLALERSMHYGIEVRVIRGVRYQGGAGSKVYVYDGLYKIVDYWFDTGKSGFGVYKFKLVRIEGQIDLGSMILKYAANLRTRPLEVRPKGYLSLDISAKRENLPVYLYNDLDNNQEPMYFEYLTRTVFPPFVIQTATSGSGCDCTSGCIDGCFCSRKNGGEFSYDQNGILLRGKPVIFECGSSCRCPPSCRNRVTQKGMKNRLEVFRSKETGWGVRSVDLIHAGAFVCEYTGIVLTREQATVFTMNGDNLLYPNRFIDRWAEWGDLSKIYSNYVKPMYPSIPPLDFAMDVSRMRNVACYMTHSSSPNVIVQPVLYDHNNLLFPRLMVFATENVPPLRELSLDYGTPDEWTRKPQLSICN